MQWKMAIEIEIVDFPMKNGGSFHCKLLVHQRVLFFLLIQGYPIYPNSYILILYYHKLPNIYIYMIHPNMIYRYTVCMERQQSMKWE